MADQSQTTITPEQEAQVFDALRFTDATTPWLIALLRDYGVNAAELRPNFDSNLRCILSNCYLDHGSKR